MITKKSKIAVFLAFVIFIISVPFCVSGEVTPPASFGAPIHFGASLSYGNYVYFSFGASEDMRNYIDATYAENPDARVLLAYYQIDYKIDNGSWHYTKDWDSPSTAPDGIKGHYFYFTSGESYYDSQSLLMSNLFPEDDELEVFGEQGWEYLKNHSITFRARIAQPSGAKYILSPWSGEFTLSANQKADYNKLINHAPTLVSAELKATPSGEPYFDIKLGQVPGEVQDLNSMSGGNARVEVWMRRAGDKEFKYIFYEWADHEALNIKASDYFSVDNSAQSYDAESYEIKVRYALDLRRYKQSGYAENSSSVDIYSPFSNVISHNMPAWSNATGWAVAEVKKAHENGLYPEKFRGADLTRPITRGEFASVALKLYETLSGKTGSPAPSNTFTDTSDPEILTAYALDIVAGVGNNKYAPDEYISREQLATMLTRVYKKVSWEGWTLAGDDSYTKHSLDNKGVPVFADDAKISAYARPSVYFMAKYGIIVGSNNIFAPRNTTSAEAAAGYANATREQALAMSNRTFEKIDEIKDGGPVTTPAQPASSAQPSDNAVVGAWVLGTLTGGTFNAQSGRYEGGASGLGQIYNFKPDGTYTSLVIWSDTMYFTGKYSVKDGVITLTDRNVEESSDGGKTWGAKETLPDASAYYITGEDDSGKYLLLGEEGAAPPLVDKKNALKYNFIE